MNSPFPGLVESTSPGVPAAPLRVVSVSCVYPNPTDPAYGIFVRSRLQHVAEAVSVRVVAPVPLVDYSRLGPRRRAAIPSRARDGRLDVSYPRWIYPPGGGVANAFCLAAQLAPVLGRMRRETDFDVIDAHFGYPTGIATALLAKVFRKPFTVTLRGNETMHAESALVCRLMAWALRRAALVIAVSDRLRQFALGLGARRAVTIPNGVDTDVFAPRDRALCRARLGLDAGELLVLSAGSLIERKGHHRVVSALAALRDRGLAARLLIAGGPGREGDFESEIHAAVERLGMRGSVVFLGPLAPAELAEYMAAADVFCLASTREGWPNVLHEALSCGTPAVATDVGAARDLVPSEEFGMVVPPGDAAALEQALERALTAAWDRTRIAAWGQARSWRNVAAETVAALESARHA